MSTTTNPINPKNVTNGTSDGIKYTRTAASAWDGGFQSVQTLRNKGDYIEFVVPAVATVEMYVGLAFSNTPTYGNTEMGLALWLKGQSNPGVGVWLQNGGGLGAETFVAGDRFKMLLVGGIKARLFKNGANLFGGASQDIVGWNGVTPLVLQINVNNQNGVIPFASETVFSLGLQGLNYVRGGFGGLHSYPFAQHDSNFAASLIIDFQSDVKKQISEIIASSFCIPFVTDTFARLWIIKNYRGDISNDLFDPIFPGGEQASVLAAVDSGPFQRGSIAKIPNIENEDIWLDVALQGARKDGRIIFQQTFSGLEFAQEDRVTVILSPVYDLGDMANGTVGYTTDGGTPPNFLWNGLGRYVGWIEQAPVNAGATQPDLTVKSTSRRSLSVFGKNC